MEKLQRFYLILPRKVMKKIFFSPFERVDPVYCWVAEISGQVLSSYSAVSSFRTTRPLLHWEDDGLARGS